MNLSDLTVDQYKQWKNEGFNDIEILDKMHYSTWSQPLLTNWKQKNGLLPPRKRKENRVLSHLTIEKFTYLKCEGLSFEELAKACGVGKSTLNQWIKEQKEKGTLPNKVITKKRLRNL